MTYRHIHFHRHQSAGDADAHVPDRYDRGRRDQPGDRAIERPVLGSEVVHDHPEAGAPAAAFKETEITRRFLAAFTAMNGAYINANLFDPPGIVRIEMRSQQIDLTREQAMDFFRDAVARLG